MVIMELSENGIKSKTRLDELKQDVNKDDERKITGLTGHIKNMSLDRLGKHENNVQGTKLSS